MVWMVGGAPMSEAKELHDDLMRALLSIVRASNLPEYSPAEPAFLGGHWPLSDQPRATGCVGRSRGPNSMVLEETLPTTLRLEPT